jgi:hypothetical protein
MTYVLPADCSRRPETCLSDFALDRWRLDELPAGERTKVRSHLDDCFQCRRRERALADTELPALDIVALWRAHPRAPRHRVWEWLLPMLAPSAALALGVLVLVAIRPDAPTERSKGASWWLGVIARHPDGVVERVAPHGPLRPGDRLRFEVQGDGADAHVAVISLDSAGAVTPFVPADGQMLPVEAGRKQLLEGAVALDEALGPERILTVVCPAPLPVARVVGAARTAMANARGNPARVADLGLGCEQTSFWIRKVAR